ncbi:hypothetical protein DPMN_049828 [Dreissena polymorpha]|uniref:Uncharacterized protein n=1 Tax=Dreissena polymorpha TaxID=45954 RepID=A0A9D4CGU6_DREPO|nr:hypothetical protein DPMN_049828 [Dreissena polymorpha]
MIGQKNVTYRVKKTSPLAAIFLPIRTIFELNRRIKKTNVVTKFHKDWANNVSYRLFTSFHYIRIEKTAEPPGGHVFQMFTTIFKLVRDIHITYAKNVTSREKDPPPPGGHETNVLTKFYEDWTGNETSRKTAPPPGGHVFSPIWTFFELIRAITTTNVLTKFHDDWAKFVTFRVFTRNTAPHPGGHVFQRTGTIFELNQHIIKTNILTIFELSRGIIGTNVLTKFHEFQTRNVAFRVFTRQMLTTDARRTTHDARRTKGDQESSL